MNTPRHHHFETHFEREHRLCNMVPGSPETPSERIGGALANFSTSVAKFTTDTGSKLYKGFEEAWNADTRADAEKAQSFERLREFQSSMPESISTLITDGITNADKFPTLLQLDEVMKYENWINVFSTKPNIFTDPIARTTFADGVEGLVLSLRPGLDRKKLLQEWGRSVVSADAQTELGTDFTDIFGDPNITAGAQKPAALSALKGIYGVDIPAPGSKEYKIAETTLRHHYWVSGQTNHPDTGERYKVRDPQSVTAGSSAPRNGTTISLFNEVKDANEAIPSISKTAELAGSSLLPHSMLKGALTMGVVGNAEFADLDTFISAEHAEDVRVHNDAKREYLRSSNIIDNNLTREMTGFSDIFHGMGGVEKLLFIGFAIYIARKHTGLAMGLGGLYFAQKFFLKIDNPIDDVWSPVISGITSTATQFTKGPFAALGIQMPGSPATAAELERNINIANRYSSEIANQRAQASIVATAYLFDVPLSQLGPRLVVGSEGRAVLDVDSTLVDQMSHSMTRQGGDDAGLRKFFRKQSEDPTENTRITGAPDPTDPMQQRFGANADINKNLVDAGSLLAVVFFEAGVKHAGANSAHAKTVRDAMRGLGSRYEALTGEALVSYKHLIDIGKQHPPAGTLGEHIERVLGERMRNEEQDTSAEQRQLDARNNTLKNYTYLGGQFGLTARKFGNNMVKVGIPGNPDYQFPMRSEDFVGTDFDPEAITRDWVAFATNDLTIPPGGKGGTAITKLSVKFNGNDVEFTVNLISHKTTLAKFKSKTRTQFLQKLDTWWDGGSPDRRKDPLD